MSSTNNIRPMTAEEAEDLAKKEGLILHQSTNNTGYLGVYHQPNNIMKPYQALASINGKRLHLGSFANAKEAALQIARFFRQQGVRKVTGTQSMTSNEAQQRAKNKGLKLLKATNKTGFFGVRLRHKGTGYKPYVAWADRNKYLGTFATAEEAALAVAEAKAAMAAEAEEDVVILEGNEVDLEAEKASAARLEEVQRTAEVAAMALKKNLAERVAASRAEASRADAMEEAERAARYRLMQMQTNDMQALLKRHENEKNEAAKNREEDAEREAAAVARAARAAALSNFTNGGKKKTNRKIQKTKSNKYKKYTKKHIKKHTKKHNKHNKNRK